MNGEKDNLWVSAGAQAGSEKSQDVLPFDDDEDHLAASAPFRIMPSTMGRRSRKGVPNKRTTAMRETYLKMGLPHPLLAMGQVLAMGVDGLARQLECDKLEAFSEWRKVAEKVLEYLESKMPMAIKTDGSGLPVLVFGDVQAAAESLRATRREGALAIDDDMIDAMEKQTLTVIARAASDRLASDEMRQASDIEGE